jgi:SAM-dependent methyltransferase
MSHTCPWWFGYFLLSPIRRFVQKPTRILRPFVRTGMLVVEPGCGMGFFTLDLVRMVGPQRRVVAADLQEKMLAGLRRRAQGGRRRSRRGAAAARFARGLRGLAGGRRACGPVRGGSSRDRTQQGRPAPPCPSRSELRIPACRLIGRASSCASARSSASKISGRSRPPRHVVSTLPGRTAPRRRVRAK